MSSDCMLVLILQGNEFAIVIPMVQQRGLAMPHTM
jgi:hypothetical protein